MTHWIHDITMYAFFWSFSAMIPELSFPQVQVFSLKFQQRQMLLKSGILSGLQYLKIFIIPVCTLEKFQRMKTTVN